MVRSIKSRSKRHEENGIKQNEPGDHNFFGTGWDFSLENYGYHWLKIVRYVILTACLVPLGIIDYKQRIIPNKILLVMTGIRAVLLAGDMLVYPDYKWELIVSAFCWNGDWFCDPFFLAYFLSRKALGLEM